MKKLSPILFIISILVGVSSCRSIQVDENSVTGKASNYEVSTSYSEKIVAKDRAYLYLRTGLFSNQGLKKSTQTNIEVKIQDNSGKLIEGAVVKFKSDDLNAYFTQPATKTNKLGVTSGVLSFGDGGKKEVKIFADGIYLKTILIDVLADQEYGNGKNDFSVGSNNSHYLSATTPSSGTIRSLAKGQNGKFYGAINGEYRVNIYNSFNSNSSEYSDVLFQSRKDVSHLNWSSSNKNNLTGSNYLATYQNKLLISDSHRVLIFNSLPTKNSDVPSIVLGQDNFESIDANRGVAASKSTLNNPLHIAVSSSGMLAVSDSGNNRVLIWNTIPTANGTPADYILGQTTESGTGTSGGAGADKDFNQPSDLKFYGNKLVVADYNNHRVKVFDVSSLSDNEPPVAVLGQSALTGKSSGCTATSFNKPYTISISSDGKLYVSDYSNHRVMYFSSIPSDMTGAPYSANAVLNQVDMTTCGTQYLDEDENKNLGQANTYMNIIDDRLFVTSLWGVTKVYNSLPTTTLASYDYAWGIKPGKDSVRYHSERIFSGRNRWGNPFPLQVFDKKIVLPLNYSNQIRIVDIEKFGNHEEELIIGQPDDHHSLANITGSTTPSRDSFSYPRSVAYDGMRMYVADYSNNRVLIYNSIPSSKSAVPDLVLGQPSFTTSTANYVDGGGGDGAVTSSNMSGPWSILVADGKLFVSDRNNKRVMIWNTLPTTNFAAADVVLGQNNLTENTDHGITQFSVRQPSGISFQDGQLVVFDNSAPRVLIWNSVPNDMSAAPYNASVVLGQTDFTSTGQGATASTFKTTPSYTGATIVNGKLMIDDSRNYRILVYNSIPNSSSQNGAPADWVIGQDSFTTSSFAGYSEYNPKYPTKGNFKSLRRMYNITEDDDYYYLSDINRVVKIVK